MLLWCKKVYLRQTLYFYFFIGYIVFYTFHEIQTFDLLILTLLFGNLLDNFPTNFITKLKPVYD